MQFIYLLFSLFLILVNLAAASSLAHRWFRSVAIARLVAVLALVLVCFALEHIVGFGRVDWWWPPVTVISVWLLSKRLDLHTHGSFWQSEAIFLAAFGYGIAWRFAFPDIDAGSEKLTNLYFISNYMQGVTLPPPDRWLAGETFNIYYSLQHYAAALLARIFNLSAGMAMNVSWALMIGFVSSLAWELCSRLVSNVGSRLLLIATLMVGGNGLSALMPFMIAQPDTINTLQGAIDRLWQSTRFTGFYESQVNTEVGQWVVGDTNNLDLPLETLAYLTYLGDYHPPLSGFVLLFFALALMLTIVQVPSERKRASFVLGGTPMILLASNAWIFPLQGLLVASWLVHRRSWQECRWVVAGGLASMIILYPFVSHFAPASLHTPIRWVTEHTSWRHFLALHWPFLGLCILALVSTRDGGWGRWLALTLLGLLILSEMVWVDDPLGGEFERFNTTLKWWSWLWPAALIGLGASILGSGGRAARRITVILVVPLLCLAIPLFQYGWLADKPRKGQVGGAGWLVSDPVTGSLLTFLRQAPEGVVLESIDRGSYSSTSALALHAGKGVVLGWPDHVGQWRGYPLHVRQRHESIQLFYSGRLAGAREWLAQHPVRYVVWSMTDENRAPDARRSIDSSIRDDYHWMPFQRTGEREAGLWIRREAGHPVK